MAIVYGSSQTNPNYANYQGSQTYAPRSFAPLPMSSMTNPNAGSYQGGAPRTNTLAPNNPQVLGASTGPSNGFNDAANTGSYNGNTYTDKNQMIAAGWNPGSGVQQVDPAAIDSAYNEANSYYDQIYNDTNNNKQSYLDQFTKPYDAEQPNIQSAYDQGINLNQTQQQQTRQDSQNAVDSARSLYNELAQGSQQRFGGNSAGEFANAFLGREFQKNSGNIQNTMGSNLNNLYSQANNLYSQYQANAKALEDKKAAALAGAQQSFQARLDAINQAKGELAQNKAAAKISALQDYKSTINNFLAQAQQVHDSIYANHLASLDQLRNGVATAQAYARQPINLQGLPQASYGAIGGGQAYNPNANMITGAYNPNQGQRDPNNPYG